MQQSASGRRTTETFCVVIMYAFVVVVSASTSSKYEVANHNEGTNTKTVLLYTRYYASSHASLYVRMARLLQRKGYNAHLLLSSNDIGSLPQINVENLEGLTLHTYTAQNGSSTEQYQQFLHTINPGTTIFEYTTNLIDFDTRRCESLLQSDLLRKLKRESFDVLIVDFTDSCGRIVSDYLDVPTIAYTHFAIEISFFDFTLFPMPIGMIAVPISSRINIHDMNFYDRFINAFVYMYAMNILAPIYLDPYQSLRIRYDMNATLSVENSFLRIIVMMPSDSALDPPRPLMPNVIPIGDIYKVSAQPITDSRLSNFITGAGRRDFIVVCFGTQLPNVLNPHVTEMMARAFARLPVHVVWRYAGSQPRALGKNTLLMEWIPQNDLLAAGAKAFVSHCGITSIFEAARHGVPVVAMPVYGDQFVNALKLKRIGMAVIVDWNNESDNSLETRLYAALEHILKQPQYRQQAIHTASLLADQLVSPEDKFFYYVDHIARHGIGHFISAPLLSKSSIQLYNIDIFALLSVFMTFICIFFVLIVYYTTKKMYRLFKKAPGKVKHK